MGKSSNWSVAMTMSMLVHLLFLLDHSDAVRSCCLEVDRNLTSKCDLGGGGRWSLIDTREPKGKHLASLVSQR